MLDAAKECIHFTNNKIRSSLDEDRKLVLALVKSIEIIGEAAANVTKEGREQTPQIPWPSIISVVQRVEKTPPEREGMNQTLCNCNTYPEKSIVQIA